MLKPVSVLGIQHESIQVIPWRWTLLMWGFAQACQGGSQIFSLRLLRSIKALPRVGFYDCLAFVGEERNICQYEAKHTQHSEITSFVGWIAC